MAELCPQVLSIRKDVSAFTFFEINNYLRQPDDECEVGEKGYTILVDSTDDCNFSVYIKTSKGFVSFLYDQLREFTKAFEYYLMKYAFEGFSEESTYKLLLQPNGTLPQGKTLFVLSFNYTDTCSRLYQRKPSFRYGYEIKTFYVHGQSDSSHNCNLVLGTHSFDNNPIMGIPVEFNVFKKHNQRHKYATVEGVQDFLRLLTDPRRNIQPVFHVVGHSLDKTDHNILKHVFLANKNSIINVYYHNEEAQERLINNITNIIGEEEVLTKVRFIHQHDDKRGLLRTLSLNIDRV